MAVKFTRASSQYLFADKVPGNLAVDKAPLTLVCWYKVASTNADGSAVGLFDSTTTDHHYASNTEYTGSFRHAAEVQMGGGSHSAFASLSPLVANTWYHTVSAFHANDDDRLAWVNGQYKGTESFGNRIPTAINAVGIGAHYESSITYLFDGDIAEVGIYNVSLSDNEHDIKKLANGARPIDVKPGNLVAYWPLLHAGDYTDLIGGIRLTPVNGPISSPHPPKLIPNRKPLQVRVPELYVSPASTAPAIITKPWKIMPPPGQARINWGHPLTQGLKHAFLFNGSHKRDALWDYAQGKWTHGDNGNPLTSGSPEPSVPGGPHGTYLRLIAGEEDAYAFNTPEEINHPIAMYGFYRQTYVANFDNMISWGESPTVARFQTEPNYTFVIKGPTSSATVTTSFSISGTDKEFHSHLGISRSGTDHEYYINGKSEGTSNKDVGEPLGSGATWRGAIGTRRWQSDSLETASMVTGDITVAYLWSGAAIAKWGAREAEMLHQNPFLLWEPRRVFLSSEAAAAGLGIPIAAYHYNHHLGSMSS